MTSTTRSKRLVNLIALSVLGAIVTAGALFGGGSDDTTPAPASDLVPVAQAGPVMGCWTEWKQDGTTEPMYGDVALAPAGSTPLDCAELTGSAGSSDENRIMEDDPRWDCRTMGNHVCSPTDEPRHKAGCYHDGHLVTAWSRYDRPTADPLYGQLGSPCERKAGKPVAQKVKAPTAQKPKVQGPTAGSKVRAEDGTYVPRSFYSETDYNRDGLVDQTGKPIGR